MRRIRRFLGFFDWRFFLSLGFFLLVLMVCANSIQLARDNQAKGHRIDALIARGDVERREAAFERRQLLRGQRDLQRKYDGLLSQQKALLVWLRTHGISVPAELIADANADSSTIHSDGHHKSHSTGTANSGPDNPSKAGGSGKGSGGSKGSTGGGGKSGGGSHGKSGSKSHGANKGGKSGSHAHKHGKSK